MCDTSLSLFLVTSPFGSEQLTSLPQAEPSLSQGAKTRVGAVSRLLSTGRLETGHWARRMYMQDADDLGLEARRSR